MILQVAIKVDNTIYTLRAPARHADVREAYHLPMDIEATEGFLDSSFNFLNRVDAMKEAKRCHQLLIDFYNDLDSAQELYSEHLW